MAREKITCCSVVGCTGRGAIVKGFEVYVKGYCQAHYQKWKRRGTTDDFFEHYNKCIIEGWLTQALPLN